MPVVSVHRYVVAGGIATDTAQQSGATLTLPPSGSTEVGFDLATWTGAQANVAYTIFSFASIVNYAPGCLTANAFDLDRLGFSSAAFAQVGNTITVTFST